MDKSRYRQKCIDKLKSIPKRRKYIKNKLALKKLKMLIKEQNAKNILSYISLPNEVKVEQLMGRYRIKYNIFVPFMEGVSFKVVKYRLPLRKKRFGIKEPKGSLCDFTDIDLAIVPVVGVDGNFQRIGFGKGMYDRFFSRLDKKPTIIFIQLEDCYTKQKICDPFDVQADFYITPKNIYDKKVYTDDNRAKRSCRSPDSGRIKRISYIKKNSKKQ